MPKTVWKTYYSHREASWKTGKLLKSLNRAERAEHNWLKHSQVWWEHTDEACLQKAGLSGLNFPPAWERTMGAFGNMGQERKRGQWVSRAASNQMSHFDSITGTCLMPHFLLLSYAVSWNKSGYFQSNGGKGILDRKSNRFPLFHMPLANNVKNRNSF